jgi:shikimate kinase
MKRHIFLTGFMGSGKTTIGRKLGAKTGWSFYDCDQEIEKLTRNRIPEIFRQEGEHRFRFYEDQVIERLGLLENPTIIALGGGALLNPENVSRVKQCGWLVYLKSNPDQIWLRVRFNRNRPLLLDDQEFLSEDQFRRKVGDLLADREKGYLSADIIIERDGKEADEVVEMILQKLVLPNPVHP